MIIKIKQNILMEHLNYVIRGLSNKNLIPILNCIKLESTTAGLYLTTTNNDISIKSFIPRNQIEELEEGIIVVYGRFFYDIIRKLPNNLITINEVIDNKINIFTDSSSFDLNCNDPRDFPNLKFTEKEQPITITQKVLKNIINKTIYATSNSEDRPSLTGLNIQIANDTLKCAGTDSYRIALKEIKLPFKLEENIDIIIPAKNLLELLKLLNEDNDNIELHIFNNNILFKITDLILMSRLINDSYPNVSSIIPNNFASEIMVNYLEFYNAIDRASLLSKEEAKQTIKLEINKTKVKITSIIPEIGKVEENLICTNNLDTELTISFSSKYMLDVLKTLESEQITLKFNTPLTPIVVISETEENFVQLFQPIRTY